MDDFSDRIFIAELEEMLARDARTIRCWVRDAKRVYDVAGGLPADGGYLPEDLWPTREENGRGRIFWRSDQLDGVKAFAAEKERRKGWQGASTTTP
jgi:hypothetical protein